MTAPKTTRRARLVARFRRLRRVQMTVALLFLFLFLSGYQTSRLDRLTEEAAEAIASAQEGLALVELADAMSGSPETYAEQLLLARSNVEVRQEACAQRAVRCARFSGTVGIVARVLGSRCRAECP